MSAAPSHAQTADPNSAPNTYRPDDGWAKQPMGRGFGSTIGLQVDRDGKSMWIYDRCGGDSCERSKIAPLNKYDASGRVVASLAAGLTTFPHGLFVDKDGNLWITDGRADKNKKIGHTVLKLSPDGKVLMTLGTPGVAGNDETHFNAPSDVAVAPNGDIFVADGHGDRHQRPHRQVLQGRQVHQGVGQGRQRPRRVQRAAWPRLRRGRPPVRRRPRQQPHPDLRPGRQAARRVEAVRPAERHLRSTRTT